MEKYKLGFNILTAAVGFVFYAKIRDFGKFCQCCEAPTSLEDI